ncbi:MAG TPA: DUF6755 family protein [Fimbriimonadaceae bacterium]|nr:DUF6755 family protein [Fimbriimonadaceae bacterium]
MRTPKQYRRHQRSAVFTALLLFNLVLVMLQLWLFVSVLENLLGGKTEMAIPAAVVSLVCLGVNWWMLAGIFRMEHDPD